jgi:hypothetical protein
MNGRTSASLAALALVLGGCAAREPSLAELPARELVGHFTTDEGESWFRACGTAPDEPSWWVTFTGSSVDQIDRERASGQIAPGGRYFVRWRAAVTKGGEVGPQGPGVPALLVRDLLELRPAGDGDCDGWEAAR